MDEVRAKLKNHWVKYNQKMTVSYLGRFDPSFSDKPDVYLLYIKLLNFYININDLIALLYLYL
jgi:hypothetical protein